LYVTDSGNSTIRKVTLAGVVTTYAGMPARSGYYDGIEAAADFKFPKGVTADAAGVVYVADTGNNTIRKISPASGVTTLAGIMGSQGSTNFTGALARFRSPGGVTTLAGTVGSQGSANGTGAAARFRSPQGLAADASGTLYIADTDNNLIRKVTGNGKVTTFAGTGTAGSTDGTGDVAKFFGPAGITVDAVGNVYVADSNNNTIRKISAAGVVSTIAGMAGSAGNVDATGTAAQFSNPTGITVDPAGNLFVVDRGNRKIRKITSAGTVSTLTTTSTQPTALAADGAGNLYLFDADTFTISKITPSGTVTTEAGVAGQRGIQLGSLPASLSLSFGLAVIDAHTLVLTSENSVLKLVLP
jgi:sugar lactone lactonase YvrE